MHPNLYANASEQESVAALSYLGGQYHSKGRTAEAVGRFKKILDIDLSNPHARRTVGNYRHGKRGRL